MTSTIAITIAIIAAAASASALVDPDHIVPEATFEEVDAVVVDHKDTYLAKQEKVAAKYATSLQEAGQKDTYLAKEEKLAATAPKTKTTSLQEAGKPSPAGQAEAQTQAKKFYKGGGVTFSKKSEEAFARGDEENGGTSSVSTSSGGTTSFKKVAAQAKASCQDASSADISSLTMGDAHSCSEWDQMLVDDAGCKHGSIRQVCPVTCGLCGSK